jgi:zinc transporter 1/2/3
MADESDCALGEAEEEYSRPWRIAAAFILLGCSLAGPLLPVVAARWPKLLVPQALLRQGRAFGAGVILATAFIHMLTPASEKLTNPCLPPIFTDKYGAWAGAIAMTAALLVQLLEFGVSLHHDAPAQAQSDASNEAVPLDSEVPVNGSSSSMQFGKLGGDEPAKYEPVASAHAHAHGHAHLVLNGESGARHRQASVLVLELGIAMHSVIIGLDLGVSGNDEFVALLIALSFHQFFEGFALGGALIDAGIRSLGKLAPAIAWFACSTPIGVLLGVGIHSSYNANSRTALIVQGVLDAASAGILIYSSLVELINNQFTQNPEFRKQPLRTRVTSFLALYLGAAAMAFIGRYA